MPINWGELRRQAENQADLLARQRPSDEGQRRYHDTSYEEFGLIVEVDGRLGHERRSDRVRDGRRDRQLLTTAQVTTRVFWA